MRNADCVYIDTAEGGAERRNNVRDVRSWRPLGDTDVYRTYFRYPEAFKEHYEKTLNRHGKHTVSGYDGVAYADYFPVDIDEKELDGALSTVRKFISKLVYAGVDVGMLPMFFSGAKGFHVYFPSEMIGVEKDARISSHFKRFASQLLTPWGIGFDGLIYDVVRLFRVNDTINSKSGLYKIQLSFDEICKWGIDEIKSLAMRPRGRVQTGKPERNEFLERLYRCATEDEKKSPVVQVAGLSSDMMPPGDAKLCYYGIMQGVELGVIDSSAYRLACYWRKQAIPKDMVLAMMREWNKRNRPNADDARIVAKVENAFDERARFDFGCNDDVLRQFCRPECHIRRRKSDECTLSDVKTVEDLEVEYERYVKNLKERLCVLSIPKIGRAMRGISPGEVLTILARSGVGKTAMLLNLMYRIALQNDMVQVLFSMEQPNVQIFERLAQIEMNVFGSSIEAAFDGGMAQDVDEGEAVSRALLVEKVKSRFKNVYFIDKDFLTIDQMIDIVKLIEREKAGRKVGIVMVDYLGRMKNSGKDPYKVLSENAQGMKHMAKELDVAAIVLGQVGRAAGRDGSQEIGMDSARDSGQIEEASDFVWGMWRPEVKESAEKPIETIKVMMSKNRKGPAPVTVDLEFKKACLRIDGGYQEISVWGGETEDVDGYDNDNFMF